jgi:hypothetical protein
VGSEATQFPPQVVKGFGGGEGVAKTRTNPVFGTWLWEVCSRALLGAKMRSFFIDPETLRCSTIRSSKLRSSDMGDCSPAGRDVRKIVAIRNTGRFVKCSPIGDVELRRSTLSVARMGVATRLCARFCVPSKRAIRPMSWDGKPLAATLFSPRVHGTELVRTRPFLNATFILENVHSGDVVDVEHRRSLYSENLSFSPKSGIRAISPL